MQCNDIDGINASGRAPIIMQQASASAASARRPPVVATVRGGGCIRLKCQLETMSMALGKASPRLGTRARGRACRRAACRETLAASIRLPRLPAIEAALPPPPTP